MIFLKYVLICINLVLLCTLSNMNKRTKEFIVAILNHTPVYGNTNLHAFVQGMKNIEPEFKMRATLKKDLDLNNFAYYITKDGFVYEIYRYVNPSYQKG